MGQKSGRVREPAEQVVRKIRRATRRQFSAEEKIRIVLSGRAARTLRPAAPEAFAADRRIARGGDEAPASISTCGCG
jgi:hypothetical protein